MRRGSSRRFSSITAHLADLTRFIRQAIPPNPSLRAQSLVDALVLTNCALGSSDDVSRCLGLTNRFSLRRLLRHSGLPPYRRLRSWVNVLLWVWFRDRLGYSLKEWAFVNGRNPASCYRLVRRLTGECWRTVTERGSAWVIRKCLQQLHGRHNVVKSRRKSGVEVKQRVVGNTSRV